MLALFSRLFLLDSALRASMPVPGCSPPALCELHWRAARPCRLLPGVCLGNTCAWWQPQVSSGLGKAPAGTSIRSGGALVPLPGGRAWTTMFSVGEFPVVKGIRLLTLGRPARCPAAGWVAWPRGGWDTMASQPAVLRAGGGRDCAPGCLHHGLRLMQLAFIDQDGLNRFHLCTLALLQSSPLNTQEAPKITKILLIRS